MTLANRFAAWTLLSRRSNEACHRQSREQTIPHMTHLSQAVCIISPLHSSHLDFYQNSTSKSTETRTGLPIFPVDLVTPTRRRAMSPLLHSPSSSRSNAGINSPAGNCGVDAEHPYPLSIHVSERVCRRPINIYIGTDISCNSRLSTDSRHSARGTEDWKMKTPVHVDPVGPRVENSLTMDSFVPPVEHLQAKPAPRVHPVCCNGAPPLSVRSVDPESTEERVELGIVEPVIDNDVGDRILPVVDNLQEPAPLLPDEAAEKFTTPALHHPISSSLPGHSRAEKGDYDVREVTKEVEISDQRSIRGPVEAAPDESCTTGNLQVFEKGSPKLESTMAELPELPLSVPSSRLSSNSDLASLNTLLQAGRITKSELRSENGFKDMHSLPGGACSRCAKPAEEATESQLPILATRKSAERQMAEEDKEHPLQPSLSMDTQHPLHDAADLRLRGPQCPHRFMTTEKIHDTDVCRTLHGNGCVKSPEQYIPMEKIERAREVQSQISSSSKNRTNSKQSKHESSHSPVGSRNHLLSKVADPNLHSDQNLDVQKLASTTASAGVERMMSASHHSCAPVVQPETAVAGPALAEWLHGLPAHPTPPDKHAAEALSISPRSHRAGSKARTVTDDDQGGGSAKSVRSTPNINQSQQNHTSELVMGIPNGQNEADQNSPRGELAAEYLHPASVSNNSNKVTAIPPPAVQVPVHSTGVDCQLGEENLTEARHSRKSRAAVEIVGDRSSTIHPHGVTAENDLAGGDHASARRPCTNRNPAHAVGEGHTILEHRAISVQSEAPKSVVGSEHDTACAEAYGREVNPANLHIVDDTSPRTATHSTHPRSGHNESAGRSSARSSDCGSYQSVAVLLPAAGISAVDGTGEVQAGRYNAVESTHLSAGFTPQDRIRSSSNSPPANATSSRSSLCSTPGALPLLDGSCPNPSADRRRHRSHRSPHRHRHSRKPRSGHLGIHIENLSVTTNHKPSIHGGFITNTRAGRDFSDERPTR